jgi:hypothetical protein
MKKSALAISLVGLCCSYSLQSTAQPFPTPKPEGPGFFSMVFSPPFHDQLAPSGATIPVNPGVYVLDSRVGGRITFCETHVVNPNAPRTFEMRCAPWAHLPN